MSEKDRERFIDGLDLSGNGRSVKDGQNQEERELALLWDELGELGTQPVSDTALVSNFRDKLEAYTRGLSEGKRVGGNDTAMRKSESQLVSFFRYCAVAGTAAVLALTSFIAYQQYDRNERLEGELNRSRESLALALLEQGSAAKRLAGLTAASQVISPSDQLRDSMVRTFDSDTNLNVRLAAVSALTALPREKALALLLERMENESSPLVQYEILNKVLELVDDGSESRVMARLNELSLEPRVRSALVKRDEKI
ncbi:hypothetical protein [Pelagicoccus sp. SDUM812002]|uniref:hypothetical protein n=1 Tax=Pelagicoccus sp. SDUM812002 TaxID=3041266 RepID=UPI00280D5211|nr:hypothetical protein [Pelagicoccus sp. SDUM812002]MDQ8188118.1 hypothetical protein [Pelagicoccus sp. SDUM812002]